MQRELDKVELRSRFFTGPTRLPIVSPTTQKTVSKQTAACRAREDPFGDLVAR